MAGNHSYSSGGYSGQLDITPKYYMKNLYITSDTISASHTIQFCRPVPNDAFNCPGNMPATTDCGIFTKDLKNFPLDNLPSGGPCVNAMRISSSEMCYVFLQLNNYSGSGTISTTWKNKDTGGTFASMSWSIPACGGNCGWTWWYQWIWEYVGHFSWEINRTGNYQCLITTSWGNAVIDFVVIDTTCYAPSVTLTIQ